MVSFVPAVEEPAYAQRRGPRLRLELMVLCFTERAARESGAFRSVAPGACFVPMIVLESALHLSRISSRIRGPVGSRGRKGGSALTAALDFAMRDPRLPRAAQRYRPEPRRVPRARAGGSRQPASDGGRSAWRAE